ncbi:TPA: hypothetical protein DD449_02795 [Candidatus Berkelbacteria bacterium]|uniref:Uncharacterized protein n=1 Tax=Berkelbacteria bacterium GW2011_GWE1_39_12 TaxID=1618337 RepID=A0A0G4B3M7_9BACT|nr:MAG: hypothetical protein UT28_C0001G0212 [Berkelbacteria bacterium GW2011_GWE1_39_12]HBO60585.1 hypothetical protein [Candidatus Berkelbacteria bacterium]
MVVAKKKNSNLGVIGLPESRTIEIPGLPVVPDWDTLAAKAQEMAKVIDRHLDYESIYQGHDLGPNGLCPQQRINMVSDLTAVT